MGKSNICVSSEVLERLDQKIKDAKEQLNNAIVNRQETNSSIEHHREDAYDLSALFQADVNVNHYKQKVKELEKLRKEVMVAEPAEGTVALGSIVDILFLNDDNEVMTLKLTSTHDDFDCLTLSSPLGQAVLGRKANDIVHYMVDKEEMSAKILAVR